MLEAEMPREDKYIGNSINASSLFIEHMVNGSDIMAGLIKSKLAKLSPEKRVLCGYLT